MPVTKMHFEKAARIVRYNVDADYQRQVADAFVRLFVTFNSRFDQARFYAACGPIQERRERERDVA
jgi:hypothetical protein